MMCLCVCLCVCLCAGGFVLQPQTLVRPLGLSLGLGLLTLGRLLYNPCLFYLPAVLAGYTAIQPLCPYLTDEVRSELER